MKKCYQRGAARKEKAVKEQLANMTIIELVRTAHSYATSIQQIDTHSAIVREMASRLEALNLAHIGGMNSLRSAISDRDQLAAENAQMLRLLTDISENHDEYVNQDDYLYAGVPMDYVSEINAYVSRDVNAENPFKATDAWQREQMAKGVERLAEFCRTANNGHEIHPDIEEIVKFAQQLRNGEAV